MKELNATVGVFEIHDTAAKAVKELARRVDIERGIRIGVKRTDPLQVGSGAAESDVLPYDFRYICSFSNLCDLRIGKQINPRTSFRESPARPVRVFFHMRFWK